MTDCLPPCYHVDAMNGRRKTGLVPIVLWLCVCVLSAATMQGCSSNDAEESPDSRLMRATFSVPNMCCTSCALKTKMALEAFAGVEKAQADYLKKEAWARYDPNMVSPERMRKAIENIGLKDTTVLSVEPWKPDPLPDVG